ncbi:MAG: hypothetical protein ACRC1K_21565 [Planctomycetia bacterium]
MGAPDVPRDLARVPVNLRAALRDAACGRTPWPLYVHGPTGVGKTRASLCLLDRAGGRYYELKPFLLELADARFGRLETATGHDVGVRSRWRSIADAPLVVLDDLGVLGRPSTHHYGAVLELLNRREGAGLVVCSNLDLEGVADLYDDRIASRLAAGTVVFVDGPDQRLEQTEE